MHFRRNFIFRWCKFGRLLWKITHLLCKILLKCLNKQCEMQKVFFGLFPLQTIYALLMQISKCHEFRVFWLDIFALKLCWCDFFGQISSLCATKTREKSRSMHKVMKLWNCFWIQVFHSAPYLQVWYFSRFLVFLQVFQVFVSPTFASVVFFQVWIRRLQHSNAVKHNVLHRLILRNVLHCIPS